MSRDRALYVAQGTWRSGGVHVWGWNGEEPASAAWLYGGFGRNRWSGAANDWHDTPTSYGELTRIKIELPDGGDRLVPSVRLDAHGAIVWLSDTPDGDQLSPSLRWFAALTRLALMMVSTSRIHPVIVDEGPFRVARWRPVVDDSSTGLLDDLRGAMPQICANGSSATTSDMLQALVDGFARTVLHHMGWRPDLGRARDPHVQAVRAVFTALSRSDALVRDGTDVFQSALGGLDRTLQLHARRLAGEPAVVPRLRLTIPADAGDPWAVDLELHDETDPGRWCSADDVWSGAPRAVDVGGGPRGLAALRAAVLELAATVATSIPGMADLANEHEPSGVELDLAGADDFLDIAPYELARRGIELIGPEHLVRAEVGVRGRATPAPPDDRAKRFGLEALLEWKATVDGTDLTDAELARAAASGTTLLHIGHRWVRIDPDGLRRARAQLDRHRRTHGRLGALDLIRLANGEDDQRDRHDEPDGSTAAAATEVTVGGTDASMHSGDWIGELLAGLPDEQLEEALEPPGFVGELRHYQRRGLGWMRFLARVGLGGCLADDMGLGKTATALAHLATRPGPHLVVCPLSVVHNWEAESRRFTPKLRVVVHHGTDRHQTASTMSDARLFGTADADLVVTTYGLVARDQALAEVEWSTVVIDEAQMIKNPGTRAAKAIRSLRAGQKLALTGTPVENRLAELWAILDAVNPGLLGSQQRFRERYGTPIERRGDPDAAARLRRITQPFVLRRTKADKRLLPDLPDKIEQIAYAQLTREQTVLYQHVVEQLLHDAAETTGMQRRGRVLAAITRLKQICNHPAHALRDGSRLAGRSGKLDRFDELVDELLDVDERALVFTQFREMGDLLKEHLAARLHVDVPFLHGGVARGRRDAMVRAFQDGAGPPLLLVSLKAGGTGLNLTAASQVIHYDRWWNPAVEDQATDRAWRIGQHRTVNVHKLVCEGTVEERIGQVIDEKRALADAVVGSGESWLSELSTDELRDLVRLEHDGTGGS